MDPRYLFDPMQRRICALVEMAFMLYRTLLPVPVWLEYYNQNGEHFAAIYLVLKGMVVYYRADRLARALCYVRRGELVSIDGRSARWKCIYCCAVARLSESEAPRCAKYTTPWIIAMNYIIKKVCRVYIVLVSTFLCLSQ